MVCHLNQIRILIYEIIFFFDKWISTSIRGKIIMSRVVFGERLKYRCRRNIEQEFATREQELPPYLQTMWRLQD